MTEIKKYRRRVSDERVERGTRRLYSAFKEVLHKDVWDKMEGKRYTGLILDDEIISIFYPLARAVLEADAEVIEGHIKFSDYYHQWVFIAQRGTKGMTNQYNSQEHFNQEWEEIV